VDLRATLDLRAGLLGFRDDLERADALAIINFN
jgi:hypothetical protein